MRHSAVRTVAESLLAAQGVDLGDWLTDRRSRGVSYERIAGELVHLTGGILQVSYRTVARWCDKEAA